MRLSPVRCAVAGHPVGHSLSPVIHRAAYRLLGLDAYEYGLVDLAPEQFEAFVAGRDASWRGLSVTMPHKEAAARLGEPDADVRLTGVANTLVWHADGHRTAHNTDIEGFVTALGSAPAAATVLGAGATARSALVALARLGVAEVEIRARSAEKAGALAAWASAHVRSAAGSGRVGYRVGAWEAPADAGLLVSTVPADAAAPLVATLLGGDAAPTTVFDVSYHPWPSALAAAATASGRGVRNGLDLLVAQAVVQVRLFTGRDVPAEPLASAAREELERRASA